MNRWPRFIAALGGLVLLIATIQLITDMSRGGVLLEEVIDFILISFPGAILLYVGLRLPGTDIDPDLYPRIMRWCLGGIAVMFGVIVLRAIHPGIEFRFTLAERAIALAIGSIAGLGIGVHEAYSITRSRELENRNEELNQTQKELEETVQRLENAQKKQEEMVEQLKESNELLEQFAYAASHDLREPLRTITNHLQIIDRRYGDDLDEDVQEFFDYAVDGAERMREMIDDLLMYARVGTEGNPIGPVDLNLVFEETIEDLRMKIEESDLEVTVDSLPRVAGDAGQLRQVFQNLVSNAIEYCGDSPPRVHVSAQRNGSMWTVSVRDHGIGIDPANVERIFRVFQRLHTYEEHPGTGIGLALCQRIIERHGGEIWVSSSSADAGTTFSFTLPDAGVVEP